MTRLWPVAGLAISVVLPSAAIVDKFSGTPATVCYLLLATLLVGRWHTEIVVVVAGWSTRRVQWAGCLTLVGLLALYAVVNPRANAGVWGPGSDRDEALNAATGELLAGRYPYHVQTYLQNPSGTLPGALLLAVPFKLAGDASYQNVFWLSTLLLVGGAVIRESGRALVLFWTLIVFSPEVLHEYVVGGDLLANAIYVPVAVIWLVSAFGDGRRLGTVLLPAVFLGITLASRANFLLLAPLVLVALARRGGTTPAVKVMAVTSLTVVVLIAPYYLYAPDVFSPFRTANKFYQLDHVLPFAGLILPALSGLVAVALACSRSSGQLPELLQRCAVTLAVPIVLATLLEIAGPGSTAFTFTSYGLSAVFFGGAGYFPALVPATRT